MAPSLIRRLAWPLAAGIALVFVVSLALTGKRPDAGLTPFKAAGFMTTFTPEEAREIEITSGGAVWRFRRDDGWHAVDPPRSVPADADVARSVVIVSAPAVRQAGSSATSVPASSDTAPAKSRTRPSRPTSPARGRSTGAV